MPHSEPLFSSPGFPLKREARSCRVLLEKVRRWRSSAPHEIMRRRLWLVHQTVRRWPDLVDALWRATDPLTVSPELLEEAARRIGSLSH